MRKVAKAALKVSNRRINSTNWNEQDWSSCNSLLFSAKSCPPSWIKRICTHKKWPQSWAEDGGKRECTNNNKKLLETYEKINL